LSVYPKAPLYSLQRKDTCSVHFVSAGDSPLTCDFSLRAAAHLSALRTSAIERLLSGVHGQCINPSSDTSHEQALRPE